MQPVCYFQDKRPGILLQGILIGNKSETRFSVCPADQFKVHVTGKAMLTKSIFLSVNPVLCLPYASYNREKYR